MIRISDIEDCIEFGDVYSYGMYVFFPPNVTTRPTLRELLIENICDHTIFVEPRLTETIPGVTLQIEKENPNLDLLNCQKFTGSNHF